MTLGTGALVADEVGRAAAEELLAIEADQRRLDARRARTLVALDASGHCDLRHGHRTGRWWAARANLSAGRCVRTTTVATKVARDLPGVLEALEAQAISWDHVVVLADAANPRISALIARLCPELIDLAGCCTFTSWKSRVSTIVELLDQDGGHDPRRDRPHRLSLTRLLDGSWDLRAQLSAADGLKVNAALSRVADELFRTAQRDHDTTSSLPIPPRSQLRADALVELIRRGQGADLAATKAPVPEVILVDRGRGWAADLDGETIRITDVEDLFCDPRFRPIRIGDQGIPLPDFGERTHRHANGAQRRALALRDGGCVFPGCNCPPSWTDAHHVIRYDHDGVTELPNLALLCRRHHGVTHRAGWTMVATAEQWFAWITPTGERIESQRHGHRRPGPPGA